MRRASAFKSAAIRNVNAQRVRHSPNFRSVNRKFAFVPLEIHIIFGRKSAVAFLADEGDLLVHRNQINILLSREGARVCLCAGALRFLRFIDR